MNEITLENTQRTPAEYTTSKGNQPKWFADDKWYKADIMGYESLSEIFISGLLKKSNIKNFVSYSPVIIHTEKSSFTGCESKNFKKTNETIITFERLHRAYKGTSLAKTLSTIPEINDRITYTVNFSEKMTGLDSIGKYLTMLLELDAFFLNEDRHTNNIAVIRNNENKYYEAPVFDNGLALLSDTNDYPTEKDIYKNIAKVTAKPFSINFDEQLEEAETLYGQQIKFYFSSKDVLSISEELAGYYNKEILNRVCDIIFAQMRKYRYFFD